jgi:protoporphyrinogen oxidase
MRDEYLILGAGITGLSIGINTGGEIFEANEIPGGICASYYVAPNGEKFYSRDDEERYRFEIGGGHWIFGADNYILNFINSLSPVKRYERKSAVYFPDWDLYVPYPLQNHLSYLPKDIAKKSLDEIMCSNYTKTVNNLKNWLELYFGKTLCKIFFFPFHELYTAGLYTEIAPQDQFKSPVDRKLIAKGASEDVPPVGYNATFVYPEKGLDVLIRNMTTKCKINYNKKVVKIDIDKKEILFEDGSGIKYKKIISTLPLNEMVEIAKVKFDSSPNPYTSVLVINIGAKKGPKCPDYHWLYIPKSKAGFHRVGFYSNVDTSFLPISSRKDNDKVSIYVEKSYLGGKRPIDKEIKKLCNNVIKELKDWGFIQDTEVVDPIWIKIAYTWSYPNSKWREKVINVLKKNGIYQIGRYGKWEFQGIAKSIKDGLNFQ